MPLLGASERLHEDCSRGSELVSQVPVAGYNHLSASKNNGVLHRWPQRQLRKRATEVPSNFGAV